MRGLRALTAQCLGKCPGAGLARRCSGARGVGGETRRGVMPSLHSGLGDAGWRPEAIGSCGGDDIMWLRGERSGVWEGEGPAINPRTLLRFCSAVRTKSVLNTRKNVGFLEILETGSA